MHLCTLYPTDSQRHVSLAPLMSPLDALMNKVVEHKMCTEERTKQRNTSCKRDSITARWRRQIFFSLELTWKKDMVLYKLNQDPTKQFKDIFRGHINEDTCQKSGRCVAWSGLQCWTNSLFACSIFCLCDCTVWCPGLNYIFCTFLENCQISTKKTLPLVLQFQRAIICHQQTNIGRARKY